MSQRFKKIIIGSVAARIIEKSDLPVLLVPEKFSWKEPQHFVFDTDYHQTDIQALTLVVALAKLHKASVTVLHLISDHTTGSKRLK